MPRRNSKQTVRVTTTVAGNGKRRTTKTTTTKQNNTNRRRRRNVSRTRLVATQAHRVTTRSGSKDTTIIRGSEIVNAIPFQLTDTEDAIFGVIPANPCYWLGTNIAQQAANYGAYRPLRIRYRYIPQVSVNHNGAVQIGTLWSTAVSISALSQTLMTSPGGKLAQCYATFSKNIPLSGLQQEFFNTNGELKQSTNPFYIVAYNRGASKNNENEQYIIPGTIIIDYVYKFTNKLGSSMIYGRINNVKWSEFELDKAHANMSFVVRNGGLPPLTTLDIDDGKLLYNGSTVGSVSSALVGDVYWNDPGANSTEGIIIGSEDLTWQYLTDIEYAHDPEGEWTTITTYYGPMSYNRTYGVPGMITVFIAPAKLTENEHAKYNVAIQAWIGSKKIDRTAASIFNGGMFCQLPYDQTIYIRAKSNLGKHSNLLMFNPTWTSAITVRSDPPTFSVCPPWGGAKLEDHNTVLPEEDAPDEETNPDGFPTLDPSQIDVADPIDVPSIKFLHPHKSQILSPGNYYAMLFTGALPVLSKGFTIDKDTLYDPLQFRQDYYIASQVDNPEIPMDLSALFGTFPFFTDTYTAGSATQQWDFTPSECSPLVYLSDNTLFEPILTGEDKNANYWSLSPSTTNGSYIGIVKVTDLESRVEDNLIALPEPAQPVRIFLKNLFTSRVSYWAEIGIDGGEKPSYKAITSFNNSIVPALNSSQLTFPSGGFHDANLISAYYYQH